LVLEGLEEAVVENGDVGGLDAGELEDVDDAVGGDVVVDDARQPPAPAHKAAAVVKLAADLSAAAGGGDARPGYAEVRAETPRMRRFRHIFSGRQTEEEVPSRISGLESGGGGNRTLVRKCLPERFYVRIR
jgi:hypothetical protein